MPASDLPFESRVVVEAWERRSQARAALLAEATRRMLDAAGIGTGSRVLDIGTGTGDTALMAAERVGSSGQVIAIDASPAMIEQAISKVRAAGVAHIDLRIMDAARLEFDDASVDAVIGRNAMQFLPAWPVPLAGFRRVLKSGGRLAFIVWAGTEQNPYFQLPVELARQHGWMRAPAAAFEGPYRLSDPGRLLADLKEAGFHEAAVERVEANVRMMDGAALSAYLREGPMYHANADHLTAAEKAAFDERLTSAIEQFREGDAYRIAAVSLLASGTV